MKVVLFCGGLGTRIREYSEKIPKPMIPIGYRPILWHVMKYYAHFGHMDFILALGYKAEVIKSFFLDYRNEMSADFTLSGRYRDIQLASSDIENWRITFVDTGLESNIGERLLAVRRYLGDEEMFLANYSDGLTDLDLTGHIKRFRRSNAIATFMTVKPPLTYHAVNTDEDGTVTQMSPVSSIDLRINGGYFVLRREIFDHMNPGEELVEEPFQRLIKEQRLVAYRHSGFWAPMDTLRDKQQLEGLFATGRPPWGVWMPRNEN